jgi:tetratricopeptide (TPR) repeat protein
VHENPAASYRFWSLLGDAQDRLGVLYVETQRPSEAESHFQRALVIRRALVKKDPENPAFQSGLAGGLYELALVYWDSHRDLAEGLSDQALAIRERLVQSHPEVIKYQSDLADSLNNLAILYSASQQDRAISFLRRTVEIRGELARRDPRSTRYQNLLADSLNNLALLLVKDKVAEAEVFFRRAIEIEEKLVRSHPERIEYGYTLGAMYGNLGSLAMDKSDARPALDWYDRARRTLGDVLEREPRHTDAGEFLINVTVGRAWALARLGRRQEALADADRAVRSSQSDWIGAGGVLFTAARVHAIVSALVLKNGEEPEAARTVLADEHAKLALGLLRRAQDSSIFQNPEALVQLKSDADFDSLRSRSEYHALIGALAFPANPFGPET